MFYQKTSICIYKIHATFRSEGKFKKKCNEKGILDIPLPKKIYIPFSESGF